VKRCFGMMVGSARLSLREVQVWQLLALGVSAKQTGLTLGVSLKTIEAHRAHLYEKTGCGNLADLTRAAIRYGVIRVPLV
jgi:DNA-binding CsgD family transcriptional regulator